MKKNIENLGNLDQIRTFVMIVEENGFAAAARKQQISTAAISRQIKALEKTLGTQLLKRTTRKISLTDLGAQYFEHCKTAIAELTAAQEAISGSQKEPAGTIKILSNRYFAFSRIIPRLKEFTQRYPKLNVELKLDENFPDLEKEKIDLVIGVTAIEQADLVRRRIADTQQILCASPEYLKKHGTPKKPEDLKNHVLLVHSGSCKKMETMTFKGNKTIDIKPLLQIDDASALLECTLNGMGISRLRDYMVELAIKEKKLIEVLASYREPAQPIYLYYSSSRYLKAKIRHFIDFYLDK